MSDAHTPGDLMTPETSLTIARLLAERDALRVQRDELLAALKAWMFANALYTDRDYNFDPDTEWEKAMDMADAAVERCREATP